MIQEIGNTPHDLNDIRSVYFGGGTPSLLSQEDIRNLLGALRKRFDLSGVQEVTFEANPEDLTPEYCAMLAEEGIDRLSIGIQSFFTNDLEAMNRVHNDQQAHAAIENAIQAGITNLNIDLIYGLPWSPEDRFEKNLSILSEKEVQHLSAYALTVEERTALAHQIKKGTQKNVNEDHAHRDFVLLQAWARENGFEHYEISNLSRPGHRAVHNSSYWTNAPYLGFGPAAHSFTGDRRSWNVSNNAGYIRALQVGEQPSETEILSKPDQYNEMVMTGLRTSRGVSLDRVKKLGDQFLEHLLHEARRKIDAGLLTEEKGHLILVRDQWFFADGHAADLFFISDRD